MTYKAFADLLGTSYGKFNLNMQCSYTYTDILRGWIMIFVREILNRKVHLFFEIRILHKYLLN